MANSSPRQPLQSFSVGDAVTLGIRIYRTHFKAYFQTSLIATLWSFIPIYGWAKGVEMMGRISRHAFADLTNQPEPMSDSAKVTEPLLWRFWWASILVGLIALAAIFVYIIGCAALLIFLFSVSETVGIIVGIICLILGLFLLLRLTCRLFIYQVAIAVEESATASASIDRSLNLTKGSAGRIQWVVMVATIITYVLTVPIQALRIAVQLGQVVDSSIAPLLSLILLVLGILSNVIVLPFWQAIAAIIYYDVRSRREGLGLKLRPE